MEFKRGCWEAYGGFDLGEIFGGEPSADGGKDLTAVRKSRF